MDTLYTSRGEPIAYIDDDGQSIYLFNGEPVAWLSREQIYTYRVDTWAGIRLAGSMTGPAIRPCSPPERQVDL